MMKPRITNLDWLDCLEQEDPGPNDLVLCDPPYLLKRGVGVYHPHDIVPIVLINYLQKAQFNWLLCEEYQPLYIRAFGEPIFKKWTPTKSVNNRICTTKWRLECLWTKGVKR
jgi:hypothetical protein